jgi:hypothetical protein
MGFFIPKYRQKIVEKKVFNRLSIVWTYSGSPLPEFMFFDAALFRIKKHFKIAFDKKGC